MASHDPAGASARGRLRAHLALPLHRNAYFLLLGAGSGSLLGFVFWTLAARRFPADAVGLGSVLISGIMIVSVVCQLGLNAVLFRYLPAAGASARALIVRSYGLTAALSALAGLGAALGSGVWAPDSAFLHESPWWVLAFVAGTVAWTIFSLQDAVLTGLRQARWVPVENALFSAARIAMLFALVGVGARAGVFLAWIVPVLVALVPVNLLIFARLVPEHLRAGAEARLERATILGLAAGNYLGTLFVMASTTLLPVIVAAEAGSRTTAYFYIPWTISIALQLVPLNTTTSLTVEAAYDESRLRDYCRSISVQTLRLLLPVVAVLTLGAHYVLLVFGRAYAREGAWCLRLLALAAIPSVVVMLGIAVARIHHDGRMALLIPGAASVLTIALTLLLLPRVGIVGVGWATLAGQLAVAGWLLAGLLRPVYFARA